MNKHINTTINALASALDIPTEAARDFRRIAMALHNWAEQECGDGDDHESWAIERDDTTGLPYMCRYPHTGLPYMCRYPHTGKATRTRIPDREAGALKRCQALCDKHGLFFFHQTDPRGASLYLSREPLTEADYTRGRAVPMK